MSPIAPIPLVSRWLHIVSACLVLGGLFFMCFILPRALAGLNAEQRTYGRLRARGVFKMVVHTVILLLLVTGVYNAFLNLPHYKQNPAVMHSLLGMHILLALLAFAVALYALAGKFPRPGAGALMLLNIILILLAIAAASALKGVRDNALANPAPTSAPATMP